MALIKCPDCGRDVSDVAPSCLGCGRPQNLKHSDVLTANKDEAYIPIKRTRGRAAVRLFILGNAIGLSIILGTAFLNDRGVLDGLKVPVNFIPSLNLGLESSGERLVRRLGVDILDELGSASPACRRFAKIDTVTTEKDWMFSRVGTASLFISGRNNSVVKIDYHIESAGEKVYANPKDPTAAQLSVFRFGLGGCS